MPDDFVIARNPDGDSTLPYLLRIPLGERGVILKARETWPRTAKIYCHRVEEWPEDVEVVERVPVRSCVRRGASIDLVLDRGRENRSQLVMTTIKGGRQAIFWQSARTTKQARPAGAIPRARASGLQDLEIVVDSHERYAYGFSDQQATTVKAALVAGDYGVVRAGALVASVERKSLDDLVSSLTSGKLRYQLADLAAVPRAAVVVEDRYSQVLGVKHVRPAVVLEGLAECQVRWPQVPIHFCETRKLAQEWTYRFLAAAWVAAAEEDHGVAAVADLADAPPLTPAPATPAEIRAWAAVQGYVVSDRGRIPRDVAAAYEAARA
ncbi:ERCC4 domain-containing protein [Nocardioides plantarum]|uniref:Histone-like nucleoid-structuring protein Lsr2 n=1 Tax=Nocardioides plantarum TaxID=29299 RepID=A0ABV5K9C3_9ACTN|nr:ERCC4 domain-containing protein [Nocardioides plantarum]